MTQTIWTNVEVVIKRQRLLSWFVVVTAEHGRLPGRWTTSKATNRGAKRMSRNLVAYLKGDQDDPRAFIWWG